MILPLLFSRRAGREPSWHPGERRFTHWWSGTANSQGWWSGKTRL